MTDTAARSVQIAHVLFLDIVGYSRETTTTQGRLLERLNAAVSGAAAFAEATARGTALPLPTGDGMALLFYEDVTAPARCAVEVTRALNADPIPLRMGIHSGLVQKQMDIAGKENVVGEAINTAQRVMDFGEAGHILLSAQYAGWLGQFDEWKERVTPLGEGVAKHGLRLSVFSLHGRDFGKADAPPRMTASGGPPTARASKSAPTPAPASSHAAVPAAVTPAQNVVRLYKSATTGRRNGNPDEAVLTFLEESLKADGHSVYVDRGGKLSSQWARQIEEQIRGADAVVAIVSPRSLQSEMLTFELETADDQYHRTGKPLILPVSIGLDNGVEGPVAAIIAPLNQFRWEGQGDDHKLVAELLSAIREPLKPRAVEVRLEPVGGAVPPDSPFYIERACDADLRNAILAQESILLIKGARQIGKTSLEARGAKLAREQGWRVAVTDFQKLNTTQMADEDRFYRLLAMTLARQLKYQYDFQNEWDDLFGANLNMENFLRELLDAADEPLIWCMDEVDKLFAAPFASDFFGLVRSWHNSRSTEPFGPWSKLTVLIAYATEAHLFIQDLNQSPFNVGRRLDLEDFNLQQVVDLNGRYGSPLQSYTEAERLHELIGGQPFLARRALDALATGKWDFAGLMDAADRDDGPFSDHLKRILVSVSQLPEVTEYVQGVLAGKATPGTNQSAYYRLLAAGVIRQDRDGSVRFRCDLYRRYLQEHLH
jgi:class 3 adenylate cyclase